MIMKANSEVANEQEMVHEFRGQQPVVIMKHPNRCGVKGHSH